MREITQLLGAEGEHVQTTTVTRSSFIHYFNITHNYAFQTYRGRFLISMDYNTRYFSDETANHLLNEIINLCYSIIKY